MKYRYFPIIRWKAGERTALQHLSASSRADLTPLFVLAPDQYVGRKPTKKLAAVPPPAVFAQQALTSWGTAPFIMDALALPVGTARHPLGAIGAASNAAGLALIPGTTLSAPAPYAAAVNALAASDGRGVALRIDLQELATSATWVPTWPHLQADTDLIIDLGATVSVANSLGASLDPSFQRLAGGGNWRSVAVAGSSMPANFTGVPSGVYPIPRIEVSLWQRLVGHMPYRLDFGDYTTVSTAPAPSGIAWGFPINAKYTLDTEFLICRGVKTTGLGGVTMDLQLQGHAQSIRGYPGRMPIPTCWADQEIDRIAGGGAPGGLTGWVSLSVNRHIERTRASLP